MSIAAASDVFIGENRFLPPSSTPSMMDVDFLFATHLPLHSPLPGPIQPGDPYT